MMEQVNAFLSKKPDRRTLIISMVILAMMCLCCMCLAFYLWRGVPAQPTPTSTPTATPTATATPTLTPTITETGTQQPSHTPTLTATATLTVTRTVTPSKVPTISVTPSITPTKRPSFTPTITPTPNPLSGAEHLAIYYQTGSVWVTSRHNNLLVELDPTDLHVISSIDVDSPNGIDILQEKGLAYVTNRNPGTVTEVDLNAHKITRTIPVGKEPRSVTVVQSTGAVFVANFASNDISCVAPSVDQAVTAVPRRIELSGPTTILAFTYNTTVPNTALVVDSKGHVAIVGFSSPATTFKSVQTAPCSLSPITSISSDALVGLAQSTANELWFFVSDKTAKKLVLLPNIQDLSTPKEFGFKNEPGAVLDLGRCIAAVIPSENRLYMIDIALTKDYKHAVTGKQGKEGGQGLAYNSQTDVVYVSNAGENTVTRIENPCK